MKSPNKSLQGSSQRQLAEEIVRFDNWVRAYRATAAVTFALCILALAGKLFYSPEYLFIPLLIIVVTSPVVLLELSKRRYRLEQRVESCTELEELPALIHAAKERASTLHDLVYPPIIRILPLLTEANRDLLLPSAYSWMHDVLKTGAQSALFNSSLTQAILLAMPHIAIPDSVPVIERVASKGDFHEIRSTAATVLPAVRECASRVQKSEKLLRATDFPVNAEALLRPAGGTDVMDDEHLLRPSGLGG